MRIPNILGVAALGMVLGAATISNGRDLPGSEREIHLSNGSKVTLNEVPKNVRKTIELQAQGARIEDIDKGTWQGKTVYQAAFKRDGQHTELLVDESGSVLQPQFTAGAPKGAVGEADAKLKDLPEAVRSSIKSALGDSPIQSVNKVTVQGNEAYDVTYRRHNKDVTVTFGQRGRLLRTAGQDTVRLNWESLPAPVMKTLENEDGAKSLIHFGTESAEGKNLYHFGFLKGGEYQKAKIAADGQLLDRKQVVGFVEPLAATQKLSFDQAPAAVKQQVRSIAGEAKIEDVERGRLGGRTVYQVAFKKGDLHHELRVAEDGTYVDEIAGTEFRFPGSLSLSEVPPAVRQTVREKVGSAQINDIDRNVAPDGRVYYEIGFKKDGGPQLELQVAEDGSVIREASGAETNP